jgi:hypothetical protein
MSPLEASLLISALALPLFWLVQRQFDRLDDPAYLRSVGVIIVLEQALQERTEVIGSYQGHPIWGTVTFKGARYRFSRIVRQAAKEKISAGELYLEPGLVYVVA